MPGEVSHSVPEVVQQQGGHVLAHAQADQDALHGYVGSCSGERVGRQLPTTHAEPVGQGAQVVAGVFALSDSPGDRRDPSFWVAVAKELEGTDIDYIDGEALAVLIGRVV